MQSYQVKKMDVKRILRNSNILNCVEINRSMRINRSIDQVLLDKRNESVREYFSLNL